MDFIQKVSSSFEKDNAKIANFDSNKQYNNIFASNGKHWTVLYAYTVWQVGVLANVMHIFWCCQGQFVLSSSCLIPKGDVFVASHMYHILCIL